MSLANIQGKLSRTEMKNIMADSGSVGGGCCPNGSIAHCYGTQSNCQEQLGVIAKLAKQTAILTVL